MLPINDFLDKISHKTKENLLPVGEYFLSLVIGEKQVKSGIWNITEAGGQGVAYGSWESWGGEDAEELIVAADTSIATVVAKLPDILGKQPTKVILGLPDFWVDGTAIRKEKLEILQTACRKLLLKPLGFVVTPEAIAYFLKKEEGGSPSIILISLDESDITVSVIFQGKFLGSKVVGRSSSLALDLEEGLLRFNFEEVLPSRIMLLGGGDLEEEKQTLISYPWVGPDSKKLNFLQLPKIEIAPENFEVTAVILAGSYELGQEARKASLPTKEQAKEEILSEAAAEKEELSAAPFSENKFGFIQGEDILTLNPPAEDTQAKTESLETNTVELAERKVGKPKIFSEFPRRFRLSFNWLRKIISSFSWIFSIFSQRTLAVIATILVLFVLTGVFVFWKLEKSEIKLFVNSQKIEKEFEFTVSSQVDTVDSEKMILPAFEAMVEISDKKMMSVTGKKTVGEKASGEVMVYNQTFQVKTLPANTILNGPGGLKFHLRDEVKVASKTADLKEFGKEVYKWGEAKTIIVADDIGAQYNLAADSILTFESFPSSSFLAKNQSPLAGGSSREIQAVSKTDKDNLRKEVGQELEKKGREQIKSKISEKDILLEDSIQTKNKVEIFDGEIGDEASTLSLEAKANFSALFFKDEDVKILFEKVTLPLIPAGYQKKPIAEERNFVARNKEEGLYLARVKMEVLPDIRTDEIGSKLKGKTLAKGEAYLKSLQEVVEIEISVRPKIFSRLKLLPLREKNITVRLEKL